MIFFIFGVRSRTKLVENADELLEGHNACLRCNFHPQRVLEKSSFCHLCFIPLFPCHKTHIVMCQSCLAVAPLDIHKEQSTRRRQCGTITPVVTGKIVAVETKSSIPNSKLAEEDAMLVEVLEMNPPERNNNVSAGIMRKHEGEEDDNGTSENVVHAKGLEIV